MADRQLIPPHRIETIGNRYLRISFDAEPSPLLTSVMFGARDRLIKIEGVTEVICGYSTLLVEASDPLRLSEKLETLVQPAPDPEPLVHRLQLTYDGDDVDWVCDHLSLSKSELSRLHSSQSYHVVALGSPGFVYLSLTSPLLAVPRLASPRRAVAPGSVGLAGRQTGIYRSERPGGWRIIGTCAEIPEVDPGDVVQFLPQ